MRLFTRSAYQDPVLVHRLLDELREEREATRRQIDAALKVASDSAERLERLADRLAARNVDALRAANPAYAPIEQQSGAADLDGEVLRAIADRAGGDREMEASLTDYAVGRKAEGADAEAVAKEIRAGEDTSEW